jgi:hypothetical protein
VEVEINTDMVLKKNWKRRKTRRKIKTRKKKTTSREEKEIY